jgi:formate dehydrogenase accessory protein FdhE
MAAKSVASDYGGRVRRAERLSSLHPFSREVLSFYSRIAEFQKNLYVRVLAGNKQAGAGRLPLLRRAELKLDPLLPSFAEFLELVKSHAPAALAEAARELGGTSSESRSEVLSRYWRADRSEDKPDGAFEQFLSRAFLQPYAEFLSGDAEIEEGAGFPSLCPLCGARPLLGVLRQEGDGGKRFLLCSFCLREWEFRRIFCATCGEETEAKLPVYVAEQFPYIRVEACETCKFYLRTIDLTKDGNAVPLVDDIAAIPLSLWAAEHGYTRGQPNLLGT